MATISNTPRPGYVWDSTDNVWYPIGTGPHTHADYITSGSAINPTIVDAKGDIIAATAADTVARLAVGANDTVLTADSSTATGLKWATPAAGGMTLISTTTLSGAATTLTSIPQTYNSLFLLVYGMTNATADGIFAINPNTDYVSNFTSLVDGVTKANTGDLRISADVNPLRTNANNVIQIRFDNYTSTANYKTFIYSGGYVTSGPANTAVNGGGYFRSNTAISSIQIINYGGNWSTGTVLLYGVK